MKNEVERVQDIETFKPGEVRQMPIPALKMADYNPRVISEENFLRLRRSIRELGFVDPVIVNLHKGREMVIVGGHMRVRAATAEKMEKVPCYFVDLDPLKERVLNIALNSHALQGEWDEDKLAELVTRINTEDANTTILTGLEDDQITNLLDHSTLKAPMDDEGDAFDAEAEAAKIKTPKTKPGDIILLGNHRLMCGNAGKAEDVDKLMNGRQADMVFTDPPYNVNYSGRGKNTSTKIVNDHLSTEDFRKELSRWFASYRRILKKTGALYTCYASKTHREFEDALNENGFTVSNQIIWVKLVASMGWGDYRWKHEPMLYCKSPNFPVEFYGDRKQYTAWDHEPTDQELLAFARQAMTTENQDDDTTVWRFGRDGKYEHPTQKPLQLVSRALVNSSKRGAIVADFFAGSGSTLMAADRLGRQAYCMEVDPRFCDVIQLRYERSSKQPKAA